MRFRLDRAPLSLTNGALLNIHDGQGRTLRVLQGRVWVTQQGSLDDVFLDAGASHTFDGAGSAVVTAEGPGNAATVVEFDVPLTIQSGRGTEARWLEFLSRPWRAAALA